MGPSDSECDQGSRTWRERGPSDKDNECNNSSCSCLQTKTTNAATVVVFGGGLQTKTTNATKVAAFAFRQRQQMQQK